VGLQLTNDCLGRSSLSPLISAQPFLDAGFSEIKLQSSALPEFVIANANEKLLVTSGCLWLRFWDSALVSRLHIRLPTEEKTLSFRFEIVTYC